MLPFFTFTRPEIARNLLSYRWHNLPGARQKALDNGYQGAQFPWESAATGEEVTPTWVPNPNDRTQLIRIWTGDIEIHVSADIVYAIQQYWQASGDDVFILERGAQVILETARFWASRAEWVPARKRYEFNDVIGPDEYHDHVDNNAYTNYFARWNLMEALRMVDWLRTHQPKLLAQLSKQLMLGADELTNWQQVADGIYIPYDPDTGLLEQFDGYFNREDVDLAAHAGRTESMQNMLGIAGVSLTQVLKQPDVLMLMYLLRPHFTDETIRLNYDYYTPRTDHTYGSSLGPAIQAIMACRVGQLEEAVEQFKRAAQADLYDVRGNAQDGIHGASAGGLWQAVVFGFAGLQVNAAGWSLHPSLPPNWKRLRFKFCYQGKNQEVDLKNQHGPKSLHI
jgi:kojibiose phosphorylase